MSSWADVDRLASALPEVTRGTSYRNDCWDVGGKTFAWERPLSKADVKRMKAAGETPPEGPILGVRTAGLDDKEAVLARGLDGVFTISHFDGYPAVLLLLDVVQTAVLAELLTDGWLAMAPPALAEAYAADLGR